MAVHLVVAFLILAMAAHSSVGGGYCVCNSGASPQMMQKAIDYACGAGADCNPIRPNGQCYNPNNIVNHCSYAVNSYYQKNAAKGATCSFDGTATLSSQNPSAGSCSYSATGSTRTGTTSPTTSVPTTSPMTPTSTPVGVTPVSGSGATPGSGTGTTPVSGTGMNPTTASPYTASPNTGTGVLGGNVGMAPTGSSFDDSSHGGSKLQSMSLGSILMTLAILIIMITCN